MVARLSSEYQQRDDSSFSKEESTEKTRVKLLQFADYFEEYHHLGLHEYTEEELSNCWFTSQERERILEEHENTIKRMEKGKKAKGNASYRGLEFETEKGSLDKARRIVKCIDMVMDEQEIQWQHGVFNWDRFARFSQKASKESVRVALNVARRDEIDALEVYLVQKKRTV